MDLERARQLMSAYVKEQFGKVVELREISVNRSSAGRVWIGDLICITSKGDIEVGTVNITEDGKVSGGLTVDELVETLSNVESFKHIPQTGGADHPRSGHESAFSELGLTGADVIDEEGRDSVFGDIDDFFSDYDHNDLRGQINSLVASGDRDDLLKARESIPQLLVDHTGRGAVLKQMGEIEFELGLALVTARAYISL